jgi:hypothetical protein
MSSKPSALFAAVLLMTGCAANGSLAVEETPAPEARQTIHVENGMPETLRVFALVGGAETSLGRVPADGEATLPLRIPTAGRMRLVARPSTNLTNRSHVSEPIEITPGQRVTWQLRFSPGGSSVPQMSTFLVVPCGEAAVC